MSRDIHRFLLLFPLRCKMHGKKRAQAKKKSPLSNLLFTVENSLVTHRLLPNVIAPPRTKTRAATTYPTCDQTVKGQPATHIQMNTSL